MTDDLQRQIALTLLPMVGPVNARQLVSYCGSVEGVFKANKRTLLKIPNIGEATATAIVTSDTMKAAAEEIAAIEKHGIQPIFYLDKDYPQRLRHFNDSPILLYYKGNADLNAERVVAIVGTRKPTSQGKAICEELVAGLLPYNALIVSGLAYGIDIAAHRKALDVGLPTVGILGNGLATVYPASHQSAAARMLQQGGLLTEFTAATKPDAVNFPRRNRIVAAICDALVVVETAVKGGSMITAYLANDYNKDVFAVPGRVHDDLSKGCHFLIKSNRAALLESAADLVEAMRWEQPATENAPKQAVLFHDFSPDEARIIELLRGQESTSVDELAYQSGFTQSKLAELTFYLELQGHIKTLPGKRFMLIS